jgi:hypothetical protein
VPDRSEPPLGKPKAATLGPAPAHGAPIGELRDYLARAYGLPDGYVVERVIRHGGRPGTALTVHIRAPGADKELVIRYDEERQCRKPESLRGQAAADTDGLTRGSLITAKTAMDAYEALCALADTFDRVDAGAHTWEWVQQLLVVAEVITDYGWRGPTATTRWRRSGGTATAAGSCSIHPPTAAAGRSTPCPQCSSTATTASVTSPPGTSPSSCATTSASRRSRRTRCCRACARSAASAGSSSGGTSTAHASCG